MKRTQLLLILLVFLTTASGRVYYLQNPNNYRYNEITRPYDEQSSRDLDLSFSAGDPTEDDDIVRPVKRVYTLAAPEKPFIEVNKEMEWPGPYYRVNEPIRRLGQDDFLVAPEKNRKLVKLNGNNKGEVILELRVLANHDTV